MSFGVLDTDVASAILRERVPTSLNRLVLAITFVTAGELTRRTLIRHWDSPLAQLDKTLQHQFATQLIDPLHSLLAAIERVGQFA